MKYIITESQHNLISEARILNSRQFVKQSKPGVSILFYGSPKQLISYLEKITNNMAETLKKDFDKTGNQIELPDFQKEVVNALINQFADNEKGFRSQSKDEIREFLYAITNKYLKDVHKKTYNL
jgi:hypothetical protein